MTQDNDNLKPKLETWRVDPQIPSGFQRDVWARIAAQETARRNGFWRKVRDWVALELPKPQFSAAVLILTISFGMALGYLQAREANSEAWRELENRYAVSFNPIAMAASGVHE